MHLEESGDKEAAARGATLAGALDALVTLVALLAADSAVLLADFLKTSLELIATLLAWLALRRIARGPGHHFELGLGKLESLSSLAVGLMMLLGAAVIVANAVVNTLSPGHIGGVGVWISMAAQVVFGVVNGRLYLRARAAAAAGRSPVMEAQARLFFTRAFGNLFILGSLTASTLLQGQAWSVYIDPAASLVIAATVVLVAVGVLTGSSFDLLDRTLEEADQMLILRELAEHFHEYEAVHAIRSRRAGSHAFIEILLELSPERTVGEVRPVLERMRRNLEARIPGSRVTIGLAWDGPA